MGWRLVGGAADDGENFLYAGVEEALAQDALSDHAGCAEENYVHGVGPWLILCWLAVAGRLLRFGEFAGLAWLG